MSPLGFEPRTSAYLSLLEETILVSFESADFSFSQKPSVSGAQETLFPKLKKRLAYQSSALTKLSYGLVKKLN